MFYSRIYCQSSVVTLWLFDETCCNFKYRSLYFFGERMKHFLLLSYLMSVLSGKVVTKKGRIEKLGWKKNIIYFISSNLYWYLQNLPADCSCGEERREVCKVSSDRGGMDYIWNGRVTKVDTNYICKPSQRNSRIFEVNQFPWMVRLAPDDVYLCGGSLIASKARVHYNRVDTEIPIKSSFSYDFQ